MKGIFIDFEEERVDFDNNGYLFLGIRGIWEMVIRWYGYRVIWKLECGNKRGFESLEFLVVIYKNGEIV